MFNIWDLGLGLKFIPNQNTRVKSESITGKNLVLTNPNICYRIKLTKKN